MAGPDISRLFERKQVFIKEISDAKNLGIQFSNALNAAVDVWSVLAAHPELRVDEVAKDLMEWVRFFLTLKDEARPEEVKPEKPGMTAEQAVKETEKVFQPGETEPLLNVPNLTATKCTEPQTKKIWVELHRLGYKDEKHPGVIEEILELHTHLKSMKDLTRKQASTVIERLIKMEVKK